MERETDTDSEASEDTYTHPDIDAPCPECGAAFGRDADADRMTPFEAEQTTIYRDDDGTVMLSIKFDCPECGAHLLIEEATGGVFGTDVRPDDGLYTA